MDEEDEFLKQVLAGIAEAEIITIFFPLLRRALIVDTRHNPQAGHMIKVAPQAASMQERIRSIEKLRPQFPAVQSILGIPWIKSVKRLHEDGIFDALLQKLCAQQMPPHLAIAALDHAIEQLWRIERLAFVAMIKGEGYTTLWAKQ